MFILEMCFPSHIMECDIILRNSVRASRRIDERLSDFSQRSSVLLLGDATNLSESPSCSPLLTLGGVVSKKHERWAIAFPVGSSAVSACLCLCRDVHHGWSPCMTTHKTCHILCTVACPLAVDFGESVHAPYSAFPLVEFATGASMASITSERLGDTVRSLKLMVQGYL